MIEGLRSKFRRLEWNIKLIVGVGLAVYLVALALYVGISHLINHAITNNGLVFWTALGTVISAAFASIYGSDRAFDLNRQKELDAQRKQNLEAGRWALVVITANLNYVLGLALFLYEQRKRPGWQILMRNIIVLQDLLPLELKELRFLIHENKDVNAMTDFSMKGTTAQNIQKMVTQWNGLKEEAKEKSKPFYEAHPEEALKPLSEELNQEFYAQIASLIGMKLEYEMGTLANAILTESEEGINTIINLYYNMEKLLKREFPEVEFKGLDLASTEQRLGKRLWKLEDLNASTQAEPPQH